MLIVRTIDEFIGGTQRMEQGIIAGVRSAGLQIDPKNFLWHQSKELLPIPNTVDLALIVNGQTANVVLSQKQISDSRLKGLSLPNIHHGGATMGARQIGYVFGTFLTSILLPVVILIVCNFIPAAKRNPKVVYSICVLLAVAVCLVTLNGGGDVVSAAIAALLAVAFLFWGYTRAAKKAAALAT